MALRSHTVNPCLGCRSVSLTLTVVQSQTGKKRSKAVTLTFTISVVHRPVDV